MKDNKIPQELEKELVELSAIARAMKREALPHLSGGSYQKTVQEKIDVILKWSRGWSKKDKCIKGSHKHKVYYYKPNIPCSLYPNNPQDKFSIKCTKCLKKIKGALISNSSFRTF